ncbi:MAG: helix-turn-helix domain-containing protein [Methanomassiliicoccales archaeon]
MRKLTLEMVPSGSTREAMRPLFEKIHSYEILETLKIDLEECICIDLVEFVLRDDVDIKDLPNIGDMEILSVMRSEGNRHVCLIKHHEPEASRDEFREFDLNIIYTAPTMISEDRMVISILGEQAELKRFLELVRPTAERITNMTFKRAAYQKQDVLSALTERQREAVIAAYHHGYYDYPKRISSEELSAKLKISKGTMMEHLRKAEGRILREILTGY